MQQTLLDLNEYDNRRIKRRRCIRDMPTEDQPGYRLDLVGANALSTAELLAVVLGAKDGLDLATDLLIVTGGLGGLMKKGKHELSQIAGIGEKRAKSLIALCELSKRMFYTKDNATPPVISSPADAANLLMSEMMFLEKEHLRVILLNTRNQVLGVPTIYIGSVNAAVIRVAEIMQPAIRANAVAMIVCHNHPTGDPSPSPEDITTTRMIAKAGKLMDIAVLDHVIIGNNSFVSLKERGLGFD